LTPASIAWCTASSWLRRYVVRSSSSGGISPASSVIPFSVILISTL
jgi:hypothetical protein